MEKQILLHAELTLSFSFITLPGLLPLPRKTEWSDRSSILALPSLSLVRQHSNEVPNNTMRPS